MHKIKYSNQAEADLQDAIEYIAKESVSMALDYKSLPPF
jgi:plasmid stabilization system protein ParE